MRLFVLRLTSVAVLGFWIGFEIEGRAQEQAPSTPEPQAAEVVIQDEPRTIDPAKLMPEALAANGTVDFADSSLREVVQWLRDEQGLVVLLDNQSLAEIRISPSEPVSDRLTDEPVYLLLNRFASLGVKWYFEDDVLVMTSAAVAEDRLTTVTYHTGDLLDAGYQVDDLAQMIEAVVEPDSWESVGGSAALSFLGDVMFVRHSDEIQRRVQGLLTALRNHSRRTWVLDPAGHFAIRQGLQQNVDVDFEDTPLESVVADLAKKAQLDIRLDTHALRENRIRVREPITLKLKGRKLKTVLQAISLELELTWILRDGVLWVTSANQQERFFKTAVFDVRDLCRDQSESDALHDAIVSQTDEVWQEFGGSGQIQFARPGTLVVYQTESVINEVLTLLETYRSALRASRPRDRNATDPDEILTVYYRLHANVAEDLQTLLPQMISPDSWKSQENPEAVGVVLMAASAPELVGRMPPSMNGKSVAMLADSESMLVARATLIIKQRRAIHTELDKVIRRIERGDPREGDKGIGGGLGGGGFGGGFFSLPAGN